MAQKAGTLAQIASAGAVVLSLSFVGLEVRQNTAVAKAEAYREIAIFSADLISNQAEDQEWLALYRRMYNEGALPRDFTQEERNLALWRINGYFQQAELVWRQVESDILPPEALGLLPKRTLSLPYVRRIWDFSRVDMPSDFVQFFDQWMQEAG